MNKYFFYSLLIILIAVFFAALQKKRFRIRYMFLMISYSLYNLVFELIFGEIFDLYYYIEEADSLIYILISAVFIYPLIAALYIYFLPEGKKAFWYTSGFIIAILILEIVSLYTRTIVFTGWRLIPWSVITYIVSFGLIYVYNNFLKKALPDP